MPKTLKQQLMGKCSHFNGLMNDACDAGVKYADVKQARGDNRGYALPCLCDPESKTCDKLYMLTEEEADAKCAEFAKAFDGSMRARQAIVAHLGGPWKRGTPSVSGVIDCPVCGQKKSLRFSRAGVNGHVHASCTTADCVAWME